MTYCFEGLKNTAECPLQNYEICFVTDTRRKVYEVLFRKRGCVKLSASVKSFCTRKIKYKCDSDT
jgi:hypothetical protein